MKRSALTLTMGMTLLSSPALRRACFDRRCHGFRALAEVPRNHIPERTK